jgi:hypothetical protein
MAGIRSSWRARGLFLVAWAASVWSVAALPPLAAEETMGSGLTGKSNPVYKALPGKVLEFVVLDPQGVLVGERPRAEGCCML